METFLISLLIIALAFIALGVGIFFLPSHKFPETEIGQNKKMRELNITCAKCDEKRIWLESKQKEASKIKVGELKIDLSQF